MHGATRVFGLTPEERLNRQTARIAALGPLPGRFVSRPDVITIEATLDWLVKHPGVALGDARGKALLAYVLDASNGNRSGSDDKLDDLVSAGAVVTAEAAGQVFSRQLRRRQPLVALDLTSTSPAEAERELFEHVYKGVTDAITRHVWPKPAFWVTRKLAYLGVSPNAVTLCGMAMTLVAAWCFARGSWALGLAAAWLMTFLDTVDGKLARVTVSSSKLGDRLDHVTDWLHPPAWWVCFAVGAAALPGHPSDSVLRVSCVAILVCYVLGRVSETTFKKRFGFNQFLWRPFDSRLRAVIARRNPILLILTVGVVLGSPGIAYIVAAIWSVLSIGLQVGRWIQAEALRSRGASITNWMA